MPAELKEQVDKLMPAPPKKNAPDVAITETCPDCGGPMKLRSGRGGSYFLGCSKYPKCKGTSELSEELLEKVSQVADMA